MEIWRRIMLLNLFIKGINSRITAITIITPEIGREKKMSNDPLDISNDWRNEVSANGPSTIAKTAGAIG